MEDRIIVVEGILDLHNKRMEEIEKIINDLKQEVKKARTVGRVEEVDEVEIDKMLQKSFTEWNETRGSFLPQELYWHIKKAITAHFTVGKVEDSK